MSKRPLSAYNLFVKDAFAANPKTTLSAVAAQWRASGNAKPAGAKREPAAKCDEVFARAECNAPCAWRTYGAKSKKSPYCYRPKPRTADSRASSMARGVAAARGAEAPGAAWRLAQGQGPQYW